MGRKNQSPATRFYSPYLPFSLVPFCIAKMTPIHRFTESLGDRRSRQGVFAPHAAGLSTTTISFDTTVIIGPKRCGHMTLVTTIVMIE
jgi:hypothetical protein